jgi:hypothetical protein
MYTRDLLFLIDLVLRMGSGAKSRSRVTLKVGPDPEKIRTLLYGDLLL